MILAGGVLYENSRQEELLDGLEEAILHTLSGPALSPETVIRAVSALGDRIAAGDFDQLIAQLDLDGAKQAVTGLLTALRRENLEYKLHRELCGQSFDGEPSRPPLGQRGVIARTQPLGTLLHIAAGNVDGLPAFSVAEGLLTGNINLLKLPQADSGLSVAILMALLELEPALSGYLYVFDTPSSDLAALQKLAALADGIVVWGGEAAVAAARRLAPVGAKLIEWGPKLSFAYLSGFEDRERELTALANHILSTRQLLCSSCQVIYLDTDSLPELHAFCRDFLPYMERAAAAFPLTDLGSRAEVALLRHTARLEEALDAGENPRRLSFSGAGCRLTACTDSALELSGLFGDCLVKRLPRDRLLPCLRRHRGMLQTAGLLCRPGDREELTRLLAAAGVVRITRAGTMSASFGGEAHDGEYALRRYTRIVDIE